MNGGATKGWSLYARQSREDLSPSTEYIFIPVHLVEMENEADLTLNSIKFH